MRRVIWRRNVQGVRGYGLDNSIPDDTKHDAEKEMNPKAETMELRRLDAEKGTATTNNERRIGQGTTVKESSKSSEERSVAQARQYESWVVAESN
ncbi:hypothetical protein NMY22_g12999 [Coprinellus aureogranulatus]|nr:hypothetical protein NMY22_g12999 [Coprinellus aureogranulatus]